MKLRRNLENFLVTRLSHFLNALVLGSLLSLVVVISIQLSQSKAFLTDRVNDVIAFKKNEILNWIALEDWTSLQELLDEIRSNLNLEQLQIETGGRQISAINNPPRSQSTWHSLLSLFTHASPLRFNLSNDFGNFQAQLTASYEDQLFEISVKPTIYYSLVLLLLTLFLVALLFFGLLKEMKRNITLPVRTLAAAFHNGKTLPGADQSTSTTTIQEVHDLFQSLNEFEKLRKFKAQMEKATALNHLAAQVAHDMQSPLLTLITLNNQSETIAPAEQRQLLRSAAQHLQEMANELLLKYRGETAPSTSQLSNLSHVAEDTVRQKQTEISESSLSIPISLEISKNLKSSFVGLSESELARIMSNLLNNSILAIRKKGSGNVAIQISESSSRSMATLRIVDCGTGMSKKVLEQVRTIGGSYGTPAGTGLGLSHAKQTIKAAGGELEIYSTEGKGTEVKIFLPKIVPQLNFQKKISDPDLVLIDDDENIRNLWSLEAQAKGIRLIPAADDSLISFDEISKTTPIYVDKNLSDGKSGVDVCKNLHDRGFQNLYLATGDRGFELPSYVTLVGKTFPLC